MNELIKALPNGDFEVAGTVVVNSYESAIELITGQYCEKPRQMVKGLTLFYRDSRDNTKLIGYAEVS